MTALSPARLRKASLALAVVAAIHGAGAVAAPAAATHVSVARTTSLERGDAIVGALPMAQPIRIQVALKMRNRDALDAFILQAAKKPIGSVASAMSQAQFLANHAPTQERAQAVADYLTGMGYRNVVIAPNRLLISADGTAATARNAFMTTFAQVRTHDARFAYANTDEVRIPAALKDDILAVLGLQNVHQAHTLAHGSPIGMGHAVPMAHRDGSHLGMARTGVEVTTNDVGLHWPTDFSSIYSYGSAAHAQGVVVGIVTSSGDLNNVISDLNRSHPEPEIPTQIVNTGTATDTTNDQFWDTDSQTLAGVGQVGRIYFYNTASLGSSDLVADFNTIVQGPVPIIDVQVGQCETYNLDDGSAAASDQIFALAAARGQTFSIANGIAGADECGDGGTTPIWPADSPYVVAVAGTALQTTGTSPNETWEAETVWAFGFNATGGSQSTFEPKPPWQTLWTGPRRGVADVAFDANLDSGEIIYVGGVEYEEGGTGLAAALFSSEWARLLQAKGYAYGFAGPVIYQLPQSDFHDITVGNNNGEVAGPGYDLASGRGSILLGNMLSNISDPVIANFSYVASGATVNFTDTSIDRSGGTLRHNWNFGDGTTSTLANPSHTYALSKTYTVSDQAIDSYSAAATGTAAVTVAIPPVQLLGNTDFETGKAAPWVINPASQLTNNASLAYAGNWFAAIGGVVGTTDHVSQLVTIPAGKTKATLSFDLHVTTTETTATKKDDFLYVRVLDPTTGATLATLATYTNLDAAGGYVAHSVDLSAYIGQQVKLMFVGVNNATLPTTWDLDAVTLMAAQ